LVENLFGTHSGTHPMGILVSTVGGLSTFYPSSGLRPPGVYKHYDPRATAIRQVADDVFKVTGINRLL
jgi:hypothetical protein